MEFANSFLEEYSHLFAIFGIFGAIAVYLGTLPVELPADYLDLAIDVGVLSSLSIFLSIGYLINRIYRRRYQEFRGVPVLFPQKSNIFPCILLVFFNGIVISILSIVIARFLDAWIQFISGAVFLVIFYISFISIFHISSTIGQYCSLSYITIVILTGFTIAMITLGIELYLQATIYSSLEFSIRQILSNTFLSIYASGTFIVIYLAFFYDGS